MATYTYNSLSTGEKDNARDVERMQKVARVKYTMTGSEAATETVRLFKAPANAEVTGYHIVSTGIATTATIDIGTSADADGIADGIDVAAAGVDVANNVDNEDIANTDVYLTFATLATPVSGKTLTVKIFYDFAT